MIKNNSLIIVFLLTISFGYAQTTSEFFLKADTFFNTYVENGRVAYKEIKRNQVMLNELVTLAEGVTVSKENVAEYQAFWINGYNLSVINNVINNYPLKTPIDKAGFFDEIKHNIGGKSIILNDIENKLLRGNFPKEARFHFVLVCAGLGCPPIINKAYTPANLDVQLETQTRLAINNLDFIRVNKNKVEVSQIFEWYREDFTQGGKTLVDYINQYRLEKLPKKVEVSYYSYDWTLNELK